MREIEFKALDIGTNEWLYFTLLELILGYARHNNRLKYWCRYTGLKDKNNKKIFERDIVKCIWCGDYKQKSIIGVIKMIDGCWDVVFNEPQYDKFLKCEMLRRYVKCFTINHTLEIIGNDSEKPELLLKE